MSSEPSSLWICGIYPHGETQNYLDCVKLVCNQISVGTEVENSLLSSFNTPKCIVHLFKCNLSKNIWILLEKLICVN